jgi:hypothetical protein
MRRVVSMSDITDPTELYEVPEDERLDVDEDRPEVDENLDPYRDELRGEVVELDEWGLESVGGAFAPYERSTSPCSGGPTPGASALVAYLVDRFPETWNGGVYSCRNVAGTSEPSQHSEGRALDLMIPTTSSGRARAEIGDPIVELLRSEGAGLGIQLMIYNKRKWGASYPSGTDYNGRHPHYDHIHVSLTRDAGKRLNYATIEALLGGASATPTPEVEGVTHRVVTDGSGLNVRSDATTGAPVVAKLPQGTQVAAQAGPSRQADGHRWIEVQAGYRGRVVEGWVAAEYLEPVDGLHAGDAVTATSDAPTKTASGGPTHKVATRSDDLHMRSEPTTGTDDNIILDLRKGTEVIALADAVQERDGHRWLKVEASVGGATREGWVAMDFLEPLS